MSGKKTAGKRHGLRNVVLVILVILIVGGAANHRAVRMQGKVRYLEVPGACHASDALYTDDRLAMLDEFLTQSLQEQ